MKKNGNSQALARFARKHLLTALLCIALALSLSAYLLQSGQIAERESRRAAREALLRNPSAIESWMTFDYISKLFGMSPEYLQDELSIEDPRYPRLTIRSYSKSVGGSESGFLAEVQDAVRAYKP